MTEWGPERQVASMGQLQMREKRKIDLAKTQKHKKYQYGLKYGGDALSLLTKVNGMRAAAPSTQFNHLLGIASLGLSAGSLLVKARADHSAATAGSLSTAQQQPTVHNNYFLNDETVARLQHEQQQLQPEYEDAESVDLSAPEQQQYLTNNAYNHPYSQYAQTDNPAAAYDPQRQLEAEQVRNLFSSLSVENQRNLVNSMSPEEQQQLMGIL
jgi:hypothetical protein